MRMEGQPWTCISRLCMLMLVLMWVVDGDAEGIPKVWKEKMGSSTMPAFLKARVNRGMSPQLIHKFMEDIDTASLSSKSFCEAALTLCHSQEDDAASSNHSHYDAALSLETYFRSCDVVAGQDLSFESVKEALPFRPFLPQQLAQKLPPARHSFPPLLDLLNISSLSGLASGMKQTVSTCEQATAKGSIHKCVKSLEEMVHFVAEHLRDGERKKRINVLQPTLLPQGQNLTVRGVQLKGPSKPHKAIVCTDSLFPYLVFDCRVVQKALRNVEVKLEENRKNAEIHTAIMQCWRPSLSFEDIGRPLRDTQLCQWMSVNDVVFVGGEEEVGVEEEKEEMAEENEVAEQDEEKDESNEA